MEDKNINIIIVDDDENTRKTFSKILKLKGYNVEEAETGSHAISLAKEKIFHIAVLDMRLPDLSGLDVLNAIREINENTVVIMMTGYASLDSSIEAMNAGAYSYITKPIDIDAVLVVIDKALEKQRLSLENKRLLKELEEANEKLKKLDQLKSDFVSTVSHELRTPLAITKEGISLVFDETAGKINEQQKKMLGIAGNNIDRLTHLINDLLDISKIEAGKTELKREVVDLVDLAAGIVSVFEPSARDKGLEVRKNFAGITKLEIYADKDKISQVLINLISNGLKFTFAQHAKENGIIEKGYIQINIEDKGEKAECSVFDNGMGIAEENLPKIFEKFQQFDRTPGAGEKGTGLGLAICKGIIELHGGEIRVESKFGVGTKFTFSLSKFGCGDCNLFKEHIAPALKYAIKQEIFVSLVLFEITNFEQAQRDLGQKEINLIMSELELIIKNNLRQKADEVIKDARAILLILTETKKEDALIASGRLGQLFDDYLRRGEKEILVKLDIRVVGFPEDGKTEDELLQKLM